VEKAARGVDVETKRQSTKGASRGSKTVAESKVKNKRQKQMGIKKRRETKWA